MTSSAVAAGTSPRVDTLGCDVVVVGSGIAGMSAALAAASPAGAASPRVVLITAHELLSGCTPWAQGGIAAALGDDDTLELHAQDTLAAGRGVCDERAVRTLVEEGPARVRELVERGVRFDRDATGRLALGTEAAHSRARIVHGGGDATGHAIAAALATRVSGIGVEVLTGRSLVRLLTDGAGGCAGVEVVDSRGVPLRVCAPSTVLATGGAAALWPRTTNPAEAVGTGIALAYEVGAEVASLEFVQFHPTVLALEGAPAFLLSEAMRGEGARVVDASGRRFLLEADPRGELAPRDTVAAAIWAELEREPGAHVYLDARGMVGAAQRFPTVAGTVAAHGLDLASDLVPIAPAAHYTIGGVRTDIDGVTTVRGLFAAGEVASTGVHGANRLASNSLLEGAVFGSRAGATAREHAATARRSRPAEAPTVAASGHAVAKAAPRAEELQGELRVALQRGAGLLRDRAGLELAESRVGTVLREASELPLPPSSTLVAAARTASLICLAAQLRTESRGSHRRSDIPGTDPSQEGVWVLHHDRSPRCDSNARSHR